METLQSVKVNTNKLLNKEDAFLIVVQLTGGGACIEITQRMESDEVIQSIRNLATMLEQGVRARNT